MQSHRPERGLIQFGPFEADLAEAVLRKYGVRIKLPAQPFQVLAALLENPGSLVSRNELRQRLWAEDTFVDFEHGLNVAVTRLRQALGDSAEQPRYVETVAKRGYRLCATVDRVEKAEAPPAAATPEVTPASVPRPQSRSIRVLLACAFLTCLGIALFTLVASHRVNRTGVAVRKRTVPLTAFRGNEDDPALSPDGSLVAFTWDGEKRDNTDIYVTAVDSPSLRRLTDSPAADVSPAWSPDGRTIAFIRKLGDDRGDLMLVPAFGGPEHNVRELSNRELSLGSRGSVSLSWSWDGAWIAAAHREARDSSENIYLFSPTGDTRKISDNPGAFGDHTPAFSPDGRTLAFSRLIGFSASEIYTLRLNATYHPEGEARRLTAHKRWSVDPVWLPDGKRILYMTADDPASPHQLRAIGAFDGATLPAPVALDEEAAGITAGKHFVYSRIRHDTNIWRARIPRPGEPPSEAEPFIASTRRDEKPSYSPDGQRIAFTSMRSGSMEIYVAKADGSSSVKMTTFGGPLMGYAQWSPDGQWLAFHARPEGQADVFVMPSAGGQPKRLTTDPGDDTMPSYSHDGRWIYFASSRSGQVEIWRMPASGGLAVQITSTGGERPLASLDEKSVFYLALDGTGVRSVPVGGGPSALAAAPVHRYPSGFTLTSQGLYYGAPPHSGEDRFVMFASFSRGITRPVALVRYPFYIGMSVSPDNRYVVFDLADQSDRDLLVVKDFLSPQ
jgi:Tol biopolymer transport system component/DNA-binding winged helix-turn-helix (wHTH) protein